jgi:hypothetical protein
MPDAIPAKYGIFDRHPVFNCGYFPFRKAQIRLQVKFFGEIFRSHGNGRVQAGQAHWCASQSN